MTQMIGARATISALAAVCASHQQRRPAAAQEASDFAPPPDMALPDMALRVTLGPQSDRQAWDCANVP